MVTNTSEFIKHFKIPYEWTYRGEGNCNVVISLPKSRSILRIRKINRPTSLIEWLFVWISDLLYWYCGKSTNEELRDVKFYSAIMRPLIGRKYTSEATQVILSRKQVRILENELSRHRPEFRKSKVLQYGRAAIFDDFAFLSEDEYDYLPFKLTGNTFAVEIKPKQGWRPFSERHFPKCLFCMNQYSKLEKEQIRQLSRYCPEDLFSGNPDRMKSAIDSLIKVPQNNFRIFKNGILCYGDKIKTNFNAIVLELFQTQSDDAERLQSEFCKLIQQCLLTNLYSSNVIDNCKGKLFCEWNEIIEEKNADTILPKGCVLKQILSVQMLDTEGSNFYNKLLKTGHFKDWNYVDTLLDKVDVGDTCLKCAVMMLASTSEEEKESDLSFVPYMISSIAKDCSLMITLRKIKENIGDNLQMKNIIKTDYGYYLVNIGVFDLYPKPLSTIRKHYKRNKEVYHAYMKATEKSENVGTNSNINI